MPEHALRAPSVSHFSRRRIRRPPLQLRDLHQRHYVGNRDAVAYQDVKTRVFEIGIAPQRDISVGQKSCVFRAYRYVCLCALDLRRTQTVEVPRIPRHLLPRQRACKSSRRKRRHMLYKRVFRAYRYVCLCALVHYRQCPQRDRRSRGIAFVDEFMLDSRCGAIPISKTRVLTYKTDLSLSRRQTTPIPSR